MNAEDVRQLVNHRLQDAREAIKDADCLLNAGRSRQGIANRLYYAMFYAAEALLEERNLHFSKHGGVHGAFGEHYVKTGLFDQKYHRWLLNAFDQRIEGDYGVDIVAINEDAQQLIEQAKEFLETTRIFLQDQL